MTEYSAEFEVAWTVYQSPKNSSKKKAYESFLKLNGSKPPSDIFLAEISCYNKWLETEVKKTGRDYPKCHMATWINQRRFESFEEDAKAVLSHRQAEKFSPLSEDGKSWNGSKNLLKMAVIQANRDWSFSAIWETWFRQTEFKDSTPPEIVCPTKFHMDYLQNKFGEVLKSAFGQTVKLTVSAKKEAI